MAPSSATALPSAPNSTHIRARWRNPPTSPKSPAIMRARPGPRRIGRTPRRPIRRWSGCSTPASKRAPPGWAREPGLQPPPDNSFERRADRRNEHTARKSTVKGFDEAPQRGYVARAPLDINAELANALGYGKDDPNKSLIDDSAGEPPERDEISQISEPRREKRVMHRPTPQPVTLGVTASMEALDKLLREGRPEFAASGGTAVWTPHRPPRPEKSEGGVRIELKSEHDAEGRPADRDQGPGRGRQAPRPHAGAARRHRLRQDLHHGEGDRGDAAAGDHPGAEQDAGGAALRRVQELLPRQRGRVFRLVLRLLPAGSLHPAHRHLHREGFLDQRADRPHAPLGDARAARTRRRHHRRLGVVHLRHRLGRDLFGDDLHDQEGREDRAAPHDRRSGRHAIQAHLGGFLARHLPGARRRHRHLPGALRGPRLAGQPVRRRGRIDPRVRSAHRPQDRRAGVREDLRQLALRHAAADADPGDLRASRPS